VRLRRRCCESDVCGRNAQGRADRAALLCRDSRIHNVIDWIRRTNVVKLTGRVSFSGAGRFVCRFHLFSILKAGHFTSPEGSAPWRWLSWQRPGLCTESFAYPPEAENVCPQAMEDFVFCWMRGPAKKSARWSGIARLTLTVDDRMTAGCGGGCLQPAGRKTMGGPLQVFDEAITAAYNRLASSESCPRNCLFNPLRNAAPKTALPSPKIRWPGVFPTICLDSVLPPIQDCCGKMPYPIRR